MTELQRNTILKALKTGYCALNTENNLPREYDTMEEALRIVENLTIPPVVGSYFPTQRDYFIAKAMQGILSGRSEYEDPINNAVKYAIETADEVLNQM